MEENQPINKFFITCVGCSKKEKKHDTLLYVQWEKRYYMITCHNCNEMEAFDEFGKKIEISEEPIKKEEYEDTKKTESN